jgi:hypothetical protein
MEKSVIGTAVDVEAIVRIRPWLEEEARIKYGYKGKTRLVTDYDKDNNVFNFKIIFPDES